MTDENKEKPYYIMPIKAEKKSSISTDGVPEIMSSIAGKDGLIQVELERDVVIERLARDLYKDPKAGIREYVNNEARQCRDAIRLGHEASVYITVDGLTRTVTIEGRGSMGMTMQMFKDVYTVLGRSGNMDGSESGQFGFGRAAYLCLSDIVIFETFSRKTDERFGFLGKGGKVYEPIPKHALSIKEYGSKATMTVRKEIDMYKLTEYSKEVSRFLDVPVYLEITSPVSDKRDRTIHVGIEQVGPVDKREHVATINRHYMTERKSWMEIDNDDYRLEGYVTTRAYDTSMETLLVGIPVESFHIPIPIKGFMLLNIKNERKYQPTASRDSMSKDAQDKLSNMIKKDVREYLGRIEINHLNDFVKSKDMALIENGKRMGDDSGLSNDVIEFSKLINTEFVVSTDKARPKKLGKKNILCLADVLEHHDKFLCSKTKKASAINTLLDSEPDVAVLTPHGKWTETMEMIFESLRKFGALDFKEYMESKEISVKKEKQEGVTTYSVDDEPKIMSVEDIHAKIIKIPRNIKIQQFLNKTRNYDLWGMRFVKDSQRISQTPAKTLDAVCRKAKRTKFNTSEGIMTGVQIINKYESGFTVLKKATLKQPKIATHERCKRAFLNIGLIVDEQVTNYHGISPTVALRLAYYKSSKIASFLPIDQDDEQDIRNERFLESLEISIHGEWRNDAKNARKYLERISDSTVKEMYARFYNRTRSWKHTSHATPQDFETTNALGIFIAVDKWATGKSKSETCIGLLGMEWNHDEHNSGNCDNYSVVRDGVPLWLKCLATECIMSEFGAGKEKQLQCVLDALLDAGKIKTKITVAIDAQNSNPYSKEITIMTDANQILLNDESIIIHAILTVMQFGRHIPRLFSMEITKDQKLTACIA